MSGNAKLPVWGTFTYSYAFIWWHWRDLARIAWMPLLMVYAVGLALGNFDPVGVVDEDPEASANALGRGLLSALIQGVISVYVLVAWHRLVMRDYTGAGIEEQKSGGRPGLREFLYFLQMMLLSVLFLVVWFVVFIIAEFVLIFGYLIFATIAGGMSVINEASADPSGFGQDSAFVVLGFLAVTIGLMPAFYVALRLSLVLPATATEESRGRMKQAWAESAGNGWRMVFATFLVMLPVEAFNLGTGYLASGNTGNGLYYPLVLLVSIGLVIMMAVLGTVLSRCYAFLRYGPAAAAVGETVTP